MQFDRSERERIRAENVNAWRGLATIRRTLEEHLPAGSVPSHEFMADFADEASVLATTLKRALTGAVMDASHLSAPHS